MLKNISNLGLVLNKSEQQSINGGLPFPRRCRKASDCLEIASYCDNGYCQYF